MHEARLTLAISNRRVSQLPALPVPINDRIVTLRTVLVKGRYGTFIVVYSPTQIRDEQSKNEFYASLESVVRRLSKSGRLIVVSNFNARVGCECNIWEAVLGLYGKGKANSNGLRLLEKCTAHNLAITNTYFKMPDKWFDSWVHPPSKHLHLLNYIQARVIDYSGFRSTRVIRRVECRTGHFMVLSVFFAIKKPRTAVEGTEARS